MCVLSSCSIAEEVHSGKRRKSVDVWRVDNTEAHIEFS